MTKEVRELLQIIENKKKEAKQYLVENKIDEAKNSRDEILALKEKVELLTELEKEDTEGIENRAMVVKKEKNDEKTNFIKNMRNAFKGIVNVNTMVEGNDEKGGFTVPRDITTRINKLAREKGSLIDLVTVEHVSTMEGARTYEVDATHTPFDKVEEEAVFGDVATPTFKRISYKLSKYGGILKASKEITEDSDTNIINYLENWLSDKKVATDNSIILAKLKAISQSTAIKSYDDIKTILNVTIDPALINGAVILTNQSGYNWLDTLKDGEGRYILKDSITSPGVKSLEGKIPVRVVPDTLLANAGQKVPFYIGNIKQYLTIFDRGVYSMESSTTAGNLWEKDQVGIKTRFRLDDKVIDDKAVVKGEVDLSKKKAE